MITKIFNSEIYGETIYRKICEISIHTIDLDDNKQVKTFFDNHPKNIFACLSIEKIIDNEIFALWLPLELENPNNKCRVKMKKLLKWYDKYKSFLIWKDEELFNIGE